MRATGGIFAASLALAVIAPPPAAAEPITINGITVTDQNLFADNKGVNDVGIAPGFELRFGADIAGGSAGYSGRRNLHSYRLGGTDNYAELFSVRAGSRK